MNEDPSWFFLMWQYSSTLVHISLIVLGGMFALTILEAFDKTFHYLAAIWHTRRFLPTCAAHLDCGDWEAALVFAEKRKWSHIAHVVGSGLREYHRAHRILPPAGAAEVAAREARVAANRLREKLRDGQSTLGSIATTAPLVALFATVVGILDAFSGGAMARGAALRLVSTRLAIALSSTAAGLVVAVIAVWCFNALAERLSMLEAEMTIACVELQKSLEGRGGFKPPS